MIRIDETQKRIINLMWEKGVDSLNLVNKEGVGVVLDTADDTDNYEVRVIYSSLNADTNVGTINLVEEIVDEDDWFTLEDVVKDLLSTTEPKRKFRVFYSFYLSDWVEIEANSEEEAEEICKGMILAGEIGNLNEMDIGDQKVWID